MKEGMKDLKKWKLDSETSTSKTRELVDEKGDKNLNQGEQRVYHTKTDVSYWSDFTIDILLARLFIYF